MSVGREISNRLCGAETAHYLAHVASHRGDTTYQGQIPTEQTRQSCADAHFIKRIDSDVKITALGEYMLSEARRHGVIWIDHRLVEWINEVWLSSVKLVFEFIREEHARRDD